MKLRPFVIGLAIAASLAVVLSGCSAKGSLEMDPLDEAVGFSITAENASKDNVATASLEIGEGQCVCVSPMLDKGALHVTLELEGAESPAIDDDFDGKVLSYLATAPGNYKLQVSGASSATGTMTISVWDIEEVAKQDAALAAELEKAGVDPGMVGMPNPWTDDLASAEEAAKTAGIDSFVVPTDTIADLGQTVVTFRAMEGLAEADYEFAASALTVRKGTAAIASTTSDEKVDFDVSGDYGEYANKWTTTIGDIEVTCYGNREGDASKALWVVGDSYYSVTAQGLGGDDDFGLNEERLTALVEAVQ